MAHIGEVTAESIIQRIQHGVTVNDDPARPLKPGRNGHRGYPDYKAARGLQPIRDWDLDRTDLRSLESETCR